MSVHQTYPRRHLWSVHGAGQRTVLLEAAAERTRARESELLAARARARGAGARPPPLPRAIDPTTSSGVGRRIRAERWENWEAAARRGCGSLTFYGSNGLRATRAGQVWAVAYPQYATGFHWLARLRVGALLSMVAAAEHARTVALAYAHTCPCCFCVIAEDDLRAHLVAECVKFAVQRHELLVPLIRGVLDRLRALPASALAGVPSGALEVGNLSRAQFTSIVLGGVLTVPGEHPLVLQCSKHWLGAAPPPRARGSTSARDAPTVVAGEREPPFLKAVRFLAHALPFFAKELRAIRPRRE